MLVHELDTPALVIDLDVMERNLKRAADYARKHGLRLRPHTKTHKTLELARKQLALGAAGLTVAKAGEAEVMLDSGTPDLLLAYPIVGARKLSRLMAVAKQTAVTVALDNVIAAQPLAEAARAAGVEIGVLAEMDAGLGRVGVTPGPELISLCGALAGLRGLRLDGIAFYPGHVKLMDEAGVAAVKQVGVLLERTLGELAAAGIRAKVVSGGSTPALYHSHLVTGMNEIRPGTYIFNDRSTLLAGACTRAECAATILCTVVSTARPGQMILDGGSKTFSSDRLSTGTEVTFGEIAEAPGARFHKMNEEHGYVSLEGAERKFGVGDRVHVLPNHICTAVNLHEQVYGVRGDVVEHIWRVAARGKLQ
jgi:D-serine deaminase-like pyridoxal phosphate-dependent protein